MNIKPLVIDEDLLKRLYVEEKLSMLKIAGIFDCSPDTIARKLTAMGIERRSVKMNIPTKEIMDMYLKEGKTIREISQYFKCSHTTIGKRLHSLGIKKKIVHQESISVSEEAIIRAYKSGNSATFIANKTGISRWRILSILRKNNLIIRQSHKRKRLPSHHLVNLYEKQGLTTEEIGHLYRVKPCTVSARLREEGFTVRGNRLCVPIDEIISVYHEKGCSISKTAKHFKCSYMTIRNKLMKANVLKRREKTKSL